MVNEVDIVIEDLAAAGRGHIEVASAPAGEGVLAGIEWANPTGSMKDRIVVAVIASAEALAGGSWFNIRAGLSRWE